MANEGAASASTSQAPAGGASGSGSGSGSTNGHGDGTSLESIDAVCNAIHSIAVSGGDAVSQFKLVRESLLPALTVLEAKGTAARVPGSMILQSALQGGTDPLVVLMQNPQATGSGLGYLFILCDSETSHFRHGILANWGSNSLARCQAENADPRIMVPHIVSFCAVADTYQLRLVPQKGMSHVSLLFPESSLTCFAPSPITGSLASLVLPVEPCRSSFFVRQLIKQIHLRSNPVPHFSPSYYPASSSSSWRIQHGRSAAQSIRHQ